jgi:hypothetical protein
MRNLFIGTLLLFIVAAGQAQTRTPKANARQAAQQGRIQQGAQNGELTAGETKLLRKEQRHIRRAERRAKADGDVTVAERKKLDRKQDRSSRHIRRAKHNAIDAH